MKEQITKSFWADRQKRTGEIRYSARVQVLEKPATLKTTPNSAEAMQFKNSWYEQPAATEEISTLPISDILPREEDLYFLTMRAISQAVVRDYWIDYTRPGVLEASAPLLNQQRICVDHCWWKAESAIGAITSSVWDAEGANSDGIPGINIRFFVDSKIAPGIVRRLAYPVPAIHSGSVTVGFEWEASHPQLLEDEKFFWFLGEEVEGSIVRMIVTKILYYVEFSLVFEGADENAKRLPDEESDANTDEMKRKKEGMYSAPNQPPKGEQQNKEIKTVKLTAEQKKLLGLESHTAEDVPDNAVLAAVESFAPQLMVAQSIISAERAEVVRLATLAEGTDGKLNETLASVIQNAAPDQLPGLKKLYEEKAQAKFPPNGRSSKEEPTPGTTQQSAKPTQQMRYL